MYIAVPPIPKQTTMKPHNGSGHPTHEQSSLPCGRRRPHSCPLCNARSRREGDLFTSAVCGSCRPRPLTQLRRVAGVSMAHDTAWSSRAHGSRVLHQCTPAPRRRSLRRSRRRRCVCLRPVQGSRWHPLPICGALWHTVVARHNALTEAWLSIAPRGGIAATRTPHVKQLPQRPRAMGFPALPNRPPPTPSAGGHMPARASPAAAVIPHPTPASAVPSTLDGTQGPHPPVPSASAAPPTPGDAVAARQSSAVAPGEASAAAVPAVTNAATAPGVAVAAAPAAVPPPAPNPPGTPPVRQQPPPTPAVPPARHGSRHAPSATSSAVTSSYTSLDGQWWWTCVCLTRLRPLWLPPQPGGLGCLPKPKVR